MIYSIQKVKENTNKTRKEIAMAKISKNIVDSDLRARIFEDLFTIYSGDEAELTNHYTKINDRQYGAILVDKNGVERYCRVGVIVAEEREDMTARELMQSEINAYNAKQAEKAEKAKKNAEKAAKDKAAREAKAKEQKGE